ncbi:MAG TPA: dihydropteroate synthase [Pyrinomonadaceae bacterium]|nr:dihydropteroate synthase [Pyrinomonadaceae bacterium]
MDNEPSRRSKTRKWQIRGGSLTIGERTLVMGVLNITPDSFSDGAQFLEPDSAIRRAEQMLAEGVYIIDIGGESTRPGATAVTAEEEIRRVSGVIEEVAKRTNVPISIDTTKSSVAAAALDSGAAIVNDVSALRFDKHIADVVAVIGAGLVLMHSLGTSGAMHGLPPVTDIMKEVRNSLSDSISLAELRGVRRESIVIDPGIGFGKTQEQNLELIARLDQVAHMFPDFPLLIGTSRKSFIGRILEGAGADERLHGTMASITAAVLRGADIVRVHDVSAAVETVRVVDELKRTDREINRRAFDVNNDPRTLTNPSHTK